ncbi:MAG: hypothetical protein LBM69_07075 [Lachnospiraceae bacterium]|jgi:hypothetical protein|nr:hypothetical protein [Lachnospiraceae bacterium]
MSYDWKQLSTKIAKVGMIFLATGGIAALGGAAPVAVLLAGLTGEAISSGIGEITEGIISGIQPKEHGVITRFQRAISDCVSEQLKQSACPKKNMKSLQNDIIDSFFNEPVNLIVSSTVEPKKAIKCIKESFDRYIPTYNMSDEQAIIFVDNLFTRLGGIIDNDHEFTTAVYLSGIIAKVKSLQKTADETLRVTSGNDEKLSELLAVLYRLMSHYESKSNYIALIKSESTKYMFVFELDINGQAIELSLSTRNALRDWFYDYAREDLSTVSDEHLIDTFEVIINDSRINQAQREIDRINSSINGGEVLDALNDYQYSESKKIVNHIKKENEIKAAAIKFYLSDRMGFGIFNTLEYDSLLEIIFSILKLPYYDTYEFDNNRKYIMLEVYINFNGYNEHHERFMVHMKKADVESCFGGSGVYDLYGCAVFDMGGFKRVVAPYFYQHLGSLKINDNFDFSKNKRILNLNNYYIGLK